MPSTSKDRMHRRHYILTRKLKHLGEELSAEELDLITEELWLLDVKMDERCEDERRRINDPVRQNAREERLRARAEKSST